MFNQINRCLHLRTRFNPLINNQYFRGFANEAFSQFKCFLFSRIVDEACCYGFDRQFASLPLGP